MKAINFKTNLNFLIVGSLVMMPVLVISQTTITSNTRTVPTAFLGWNSSGLPGSVDLRNDFLGSYPLNFFTGGNSTANQRMTILGSAGNGYVGIGSGFSTPQALLHINGYANAGNTGEVFRSSGPDDDINAWRMYTGINNGSEKMSLFVTPNFSDPYNNNNATIQAPENTSNTATNETGPAATLDQNVPNPFTRNTTITYQLTKPGKALIQVYNSSGNNIAVLVNENKSLGRYSVNWNAANLPAGIYSYVLYVNGKEVSKKALKLN